LVVHVNKAYDRSYLDIGVEIVEGSILYPIEDLGQRRGWLTTVI
jgi:hypothetical protein